MTREAIGARKSKIRKWKEYKCSGSYSDLAEYKIARKRAEKAYRKAKRRFEKKIADESKSNPKSFYAYVRSKTVLKEVVGPLRDVEGKLITDHRKMCNTLNNFFASVFTQERNDETLPEVERKITVDSCCKIKLTGELIYRQLRKLKLGKAPGIDGIVTKILVECAEELCKPLFLIYDCSLKSGKVPSEWKKANVSAIFKKGSKEMAGNYRPISLTSHVCKVLEALLRDTIVEHLQIHKLINASQHGFVKGRSCLTNLLEFLEDVTNLIDEGKPVDIIYLDFQKAFDKVPHKRLLQKVKALGIEGEIAVV